jgi:hypothetical protein
VIEHATLSGRLPETAAAEVAVQIEAPSVASRNQRDEAVVYRIAHAAGILSPQTWSMKMGLDFHQEQKNLEIFSQRSSS